MFLCNGCIFFYTSNGPEIMHETSLLAHVLVCFNVCEFCVFVTFVFGTASM